MGVVTELWSGVRTIARPQALENWSGVQRIISGRAGFPDAKYQTYAREGYMKNALVFACIEELASSASEPEMQALQGSRWIHQYDNTSTAASRLLELLYRPNPFMDSYEFWRTVILHRSIAGNAYALKVRTRSGRVSELWLLRPDRVSIVPDATTFIRRYDYHIGDREPIPLPVEDVIQWRTPNPVDDFYGMPPLMPIAGNVDLDNYSRDFVKTYFEKQGVPSAILTTKQRMGDTLKEEIRARFTREFGNGNWHGLLVLDGAEASYTPMTQALGAQGLVLPELNQISESRIAMAFGVPLSLIGAMAGAGNSSYGNKRAERESFWNETLKPLYRELVGPLNRGLVPEFPGVQRVAFDLSTVGALQPDADELWARLGKAHQEGLVGRKEARKLMGLPETLSGDTFLVSDGMLAVPSSGETAESEPSAVLTAEQANAAGVLFRSGYTPEGIAQALGIPEFEHTGLLPITLKTEEQVEAEGESAQQAAEDPPDEPDAVGAGRGA